MLSCRDSKGHSSYICVSADGHYFYWWPDIKNINISQLLKFHRCYGLVLQMHLCGGIFWQTHFRIIINLNFTCRDPTVELTFSHLSLQWPKPIGTLRKRRIGFKPRADSCIWSGQVLIQFVLPSFLFKLHTILYRCWHGGRDEITRDCYLLFLLSYFFPGCYPRCKFQRGQEGRLFYIARGMRKEEERKIEEKKEGISVVFKEEAQKNEWMRHTSTTLI